MLAEPCPTVALEAMAYGIPIVASNVGELPDIVVDHETGLFFPPSDARPYARLLKGWLTIRKYVLERLHRNFQKGPS